MDQATLNSLVQEARQSYAELTKIVPPEQFATPPQLTRPQQISAFHLVRVVAAKLAEIEASLTTASLDGTAQEISEGLRGYLSETLLPARDPLYGLLSHLIDALEIDLGAITDREEWQVPIWSIFESGVHNYASWSEAEGIDIDYDLSQAMKVLEAGFFDPDDWLTNAQRLQPVLGEKADKRLPASVRFRLKEIYRSYVFGNFMSAIALTRSLLEYALIDRASVIGIDPIGSDPRHGTRRLSELIEDASDRIPQLRHDMETIREFGNQVLHPKRKTVPLPDALRPPATRSLSAVRRVVERLYLQTVTKSSTAGPTAGAAREG